MPTIGRFQLWFIANRWWPLEIPTRRSFARQLLEPIHTNPEAWSLLLRVLFAFPSIRGCSSPPLWIGLSCFFQWYVLAPKVLKYVNPDAWTEQALGDEKVHYYGQETVWMWPKKIQKVVLLRELGCAFEGATASYPDVAVWPGLFGAEPCWCRGAWPQLGWNHPPKSWSLSFHGSGSLYVFTDHMDDAALHRA